MTAVDTMNRCAPRVAWVVSSPTPYKLPFFELLAKNPEWDLHFYFCTWASTTRPWQLDPSSEIQATTDQGIRLPLPGGYGSCLRLNPRILRALFRERWDLVVVSGYNHPTMQLAILGCIARRIPFIIQGESHLHKPRSLLTRTVKRWLIFPLLRRAAAALATGTAARQYWESIGIPAGRIGIVANTPEVGYFSSEAESLRPHRARLRGELGLPESAVVGVFVGRLIPVKGVDLALKGLAGLPPAQRPHLLIVGDGPERSNLEQIAAEHCLPITFAGFRQRDELPACYAASDFFFLPSREEPWGVVVNEAMACGLPVLLSDQVGAAYDLLQEGGNGFLVRGADAANWSDAFRRCSEARASLPRMGDRSRGFVQGWTHQASADEFTKVARIALNGWEANRGADGSERDDREQ